MTIAAILSGKGPEVVTVTADATVAAVVSVLVRRRIGAVPVLDGGSMVGIVSERDIVRALGEAGTGGPALPDRPVAAIMTAPVITIRPADSVVGALALMTDRRIRHLPVVDGGRLVGMVSIGDLVKRRIAEAEREASELKEYITTA
jgi:CBS domain-containing protein